MPIKNIIFDLGGVILDLDFHRTFMAFEQLGVKNFSEIYSHAQQDGLFDDFETGKITSAMFRDALRNRLKLSATDEQLDAAWNAMLLTFPQEKLKFLEKLKENYQLFLFSNTNEIHLKQFRIICQTLNCPDFDAYFHEVYYSHLFKQRKPHPQAFTSILNENSLVADDTLFIDDTLRHVQGAEHAGLRTIHLTDGKTIYDIDKVITLY